MITVTNCGHDSHHPKPCDIEHTDGLPDYLLLLVKTDAWFFVDGKRCFTQPNPDKPEKFCISSTF